MRPGEGPRDEQELNRPGERTGTPARHAPGPSPLAAHLLAALAYSALTLLFLRPAWRVMGTHLCPHPGDPLFNLYVLKWGIHQIRLGLPDFWDGPFFFPARATLTFSDHLLGPAALGALLSPLLPNPVVFYNLLFLGSFAASGWTAWYVLRRSGLPGAAAFLGGLIFAFSPFRWGQTSHLQVLLAAWIPLTLWTWDRLLAAPSPRRAAAFLVFYALHVTGGMYLAYMIHFPLAVLAAVRLRARRREGILREGLGWIAGAALAGGLLTLALFWPYLREARTGVLARHSSEFQIWGASLLSYLTPSPFNLHDAVFPGRLRRPENELFAGAVATALVLGAMASGLRRLRRRSPERPLSRARRALLAALALLGALGWILGEWKTLAKAHLLPGPPGGTEPRYELALLLLLLGGLALLLRRRWGGNWPLDLSRLALDPWSQGVALSALVCFLLSFPVVFQPLARVLPGLGGMRVPARFYPFVSFALCYFAARTAVALLARVRTPAGRGLAAAGLAALLLLDLAPSPLPWSPVPREEEFPPVYAWLAGQAGVGAILELPITDETAEIRFMYLGTRHWKPLVNGYSGHFPASYNAIRQSLRGPVPHRLLLDHLRDIGVTHILVHRRELRWKRDRWALRTWEAESPVRLEYAVGGDRVYRLERARVPPSAPR